MDNHEIQDFIITKSQECVLFIHAKIVRSSGVYIYSFLLPNIPSLVYDHIIKDCS